MSDLKVQGVVEMSSEGAENAFNRVGAAADKMARQTEQASNKAGKAVDGIGTGATKSAEEFSRSEGKIVASIKRATTQLEQLGKTASQKLEMRISAQGLDPQKFEPSLRKLRELESAQNAVALSAGKLPSAYDEISRSIGGMVTAAAGLAAVGASLSKLVSVQREFDVINASLVTMTGSVDNAKIAFGAIQGFAATTPFSLQEVAKAFTKLKSLGLDPSQRAMESFGNTAAAMGKNLDQFIEAVADASTGEFERLKEFGIKANKEGDNVKLTFQGVSTSVKNSSEQITEYLTKIGENEFAGAMAERAKTLDGAISNLSDTWDNLFLTVSQNNTGGFIFDSVKLATGAVDDLTTVIGAMSSAANENAQATGAMAAIQEGIGKTFETVAVLGANVAYVFRAVGTEIGGLAAQAAAVAGGDFAGAKFIGEEMKRDAAAARAEIDALSERILNARTASQAASASLDDLAKPRQSAKSPVDSSALKSANKEANELAKLMDRIYGKESGLDAGYWDDLERLNKQFKKTGDLETYRDAVAKLTTQQKFYQDQVKAVAKAEEEAQKASADRFSEMAKISDSLQDQVAKMRLENEEIGLTAEQLDILRLARMDEAIATKSQALAVAEKTSQSASEIEMLREQIDAMRELRGLAATGQVQRANARAIDDQKKAWEKFSDDIERSLTDSLYRSFEAGESFGDAFVKSLQNTLKTTVLKVAVHGVMDLGKNALGSLISAAFGGSGGSGGAGGSILSGLSNLSSLNTAYNMLTGNLVSSMAAPVGAAYGFASGTGALGSQAFTAGASMAASSGAGAVGGAQAAYLVAAQEATAAGLSAAAAEYQAAATALGQGSSALGAASTAGAGLSAYGAGQYLGQKYGTAAGAIGGTAVGAGSVALGGAISGGLATGAGAAGAAGAAAGGGAAGSAAGASAALSAIPVWGWVAMAALSIFGASGKKPKLPTLELYNNQESDATTYGTKHNVPAIDTPFGALAYSGQHLKEGKIDINQLMEERLKPIAALDSAMASVMTADQYTSARSRMENWSAMEISKGKSVIDPLEQRLFDIVAPIDGWIGSLLDTVSGTVDAKYAQAISALAAQGYESGEEIANQLLGGITAGMDEGETLAGAFGRIAGALGQVNPLFEDLGLKLYEISTIGGDAASDLITLYGGLESLQGKFASYYENYYTAEEKRANVVKSITEALSAAGADINESDVANATREQFRAAYESIVATSGAASPLAVALLRVESAFAGITPAADSAVTAVSSVSNKLSDAFGGLSSSLDAARDAAQQQYDLQVESQTRQLDAAQTYADGLRSVADSVRGSLDSVSGYRNFAAAGASGQYSDAFAVYARQQGEVYGYLADLAGQADAQLTAAEQVAAQIEGSIDQLGKALSNDLMALDNIEASAKTQIDVLNGINTSVLSVGEAISKLVSTMTGVPDGAASAAQIGLPAQGVAYDGSGALPPGAIVSDNPAYQALVDEIGALTGRIASAAQAVNPDITAAMVEAQTAGSLQALYDKAVEIGATQVSSALEGMLPDLESLQSLKSQLALISPYYYTVPTVETARAQDVVVPATTKPTVDKTAAQIAGLASQVAGTFGGLQQQLWQMQGNTEAMRDVQRIGLQSIIDDLSAFNADAALIAAAQRNLATQAQIWRVEDANASADSAYGTLDRSISAEQARLKADADARIAALRDGFSVTGESISAAQKSISTLDSLFGSIESGVKRLRNIANPEQNLIQAKSYIDMSLMLARAGTMPDQAKLADAIDALSSDNLNRYSSTAEYEYAQMVQAGKLEAIGSIAGSQKTVAEQQLQSLTSANELAEEQIKAIETLRDRQIKDLADMKDAARKQIDELRGVNTSVLSVSSAIGALNIEIGKLAAAMNKPAPTPVSLPVYSSTTRDNGTQLVSSQQSTNYGALHNNFIGEAGEAVRVQLSNGTIALDVGANWGAEKITNQVLSNLSAYATNEAATAAIVAWAKDSTLVDKNALAAAGIPGFSVGTAYVPEDMTANIHRGEIIIDPRSSDILRRYGIGVQGGSDPALVAELKALRETNAALAARLAAIEKNTRETRDLTYRVTEGGNSMRTVAA